MKTKITNLVWLAVLSAFSFQPSALLHAAPLGTALPSGASGLTSFTNRPDWVAAVGGAAGLTVLHFDGPTETNGKDVNDPTIVPSYAEQGVVFLPFLGTTIVPKVYRGQGFQISDPNRDGLVVNVPSPNPVSDLEGRAIRFDFNVAVRAVGLWFNGPYLGGDGGFLRLFDTATNLIENSVVSVAGGFVGVTSERWIHRVHVVNTFDGDVKFGIWDLQFPALPQLAIALTATNTAIVSWPAPAEGWLLHTTTNLVPGGSVWTEILPPYQAQGTTNLFFVEPAPVGNKFYRLHKP